MSAPIAIVGRGCVLPGALDPAALWRLVRAGQSAITPAREEAWELVPARRERIAQEIASGTGGYVRGFEEVFSPDGFACPVDRGLDAVFLWTLHAARSALADARMELPRPGTRGAVLLGNLSYPTPGLVRYALEVWGRGGRPVDPRDRFMSGLPAALTARALGLVGPALALDAACASSLYAIKLACDLLRAGRVDLALAGGVNHADDLILHLGFTALSALSKSGQSRPFHRDADGLVPAQGAAMVLLKRLEDALAAGDPIWGLILGVGLSNDGRSRGLLVPSEEGQVRALRAAYREAGVEPASVSLVECHAAGTAVGDAVEVGSLVQVYAGAAQLPLGSLKSNLGHLVTASGAAGLLKVLGAMRAGERPPTLQARPSLAALEGTPFRLLDELEPWPSRGPRRAAVSNFGFGGNNAHLLVEEWIERPRIRTGARRAEAAQRPRAAVVALAARVGAAEGPAELAASLRAARSLVQGGAARARDFALPLVGLRFPPADLKDTLPQQSWLLDTVLTLEPPGGLGALPPERTLVLVGMQCDAEVARSCVPWRWPEGQAGNLAERPLRAAVTVGCMPNMVANRLNQQLGLSGPGFTISAEEASGCWALELALGALGRGEVDAALVAAVDLCAEPVHAEAARACLPAARGAPGDACLVLALEREEDARRNGHPVLALLGIAAADDPAGLVLDGASPGLSWWSGHPHAASGLVHVVAGLLACQEGFHLPEPGAAAAPWAAPPADRSLVVEVSAAGGAPSRLRVWAGDPGAALAGPRPRPAGAALQLSAHLPPVAATRDPREVTRMPPPPPRPRRDLSEGSGRRSWPMEQGVGSLASDAQRAPRPGGAPAGGAGTTPPPSGGVARVSASPARGDPARGPAPEWPAGQRAPSPEERRPPHWPLDQGGEPVARLRALAQAQQGLAEMHAAFLQRQAEVHRRFLALALAPLGVTPELAAPHQTLARAVLPTERGASPGGSLGELTPVHSPPALLRRAEPLASGAPTAAEVPGTERAAAGPGPRAGDAPALAPVAVSPRPAPAGAAAPPPVPQDRVRPGPRLSRAELEALASGPISAVLGPLFRPTDAHARVVRMPEPPLLLADRVLGIAGEPGVLGRGTIWTETDVRPDAWYLFEGRMPAGILVESGQADLLLISWQGIDLLNQGRRVYRLLGCDLTSHGPLPEAGDTLSYEISIDGHAEHGDVRLFFFHYDCRVNGRLLMSVRNGQAGFFTDQELAESAGVVFRVEEGPPTAAARLDPPPVASGKRSFSAEELSRFIDGDLLGCFGPGFERGATHTRTPSIQGGRMRLFDEVTDFDPAGGPWGRGYLRARLALRPDHWFFAGHFKNDPCMPGTLMFEGALQTMALYLAATGFTLASDGFRFEPVEGHEYRLRCRGQATPESRELVYELFVDEIVGGAEPTLFADLLGTVDGLKAFHCRRMGLRLVHAYPMDPGRLQLTWPEGQEGPPPAFDERAVLACAWGRPSWAFGPMYAPFDDGVRVPRLPGPPYFFMSRVRSTRGRIGGMEKGSEVVAEYDVPPDAWYFQENGAAAMPFAVLLEVALQPCGWLASFVGCVVSAGQEVLFRNLDGSGRAEREVLPGAGRLTTRARLTSLSAAGGVLIVSFEVEVDGATGRVFGCRTVFGFFPPETMRDQTGLPALPETATPPAQSAAGLGAPGLARGRLRMFDRVLGVWPGGGAAGLGKIRVARPVVPADWYFRAHFMSDPVQPGSLGLEAMVQALEQLALELALVDGGARFEALATGVDLTWKYRGQVLPENREVVIEVELERLVPAAEALLLVGGGSLWVDGKRIYQASGISARAWPGGGPGRARDPALIDSPQAARPVEPGAARETAALLFPVLGDSEATLALELEALGAELGQGRPLPALSAERLARSRPAQLCAALVARDREQLAREVERARASLANQPGRPLRTPAGSVYAPRPLGPQAPVVFVYPGMGSARLGVGRELFALFPRLLQELRALPDLAIGEHFAAQLGRGAPSEEEERRFAADALTQSSATVALSFALTRLLRRDLQLSPAMGMGFSIGEASMLASLGVWREPVELERRLRESDVIRTRLSGQMSAARVYLGVPPGAPWAWMAAIVHLPRAAVEEALAAERAVFLLTVHTAGEVMIGGEAGACRRVLAALGAPFHEVPFQLAIHCPPARSERARLEALHTLPLAPGPHVPCYSTGSGGAVPLTPEAVGASIAQAYTETVDFPGLVQRVHADGGRVFVEVGAQANCTGWTAAVLGERPHLAVPLLPTVYDEESALVRAAAELMAARTAIDVAPLAARAAVRAARDGSALPPREDPALAPAEDTRSPGERAWEERLAREAAALLGLSDPASLPRDEALPLDSLAVQRLRARLFPGAAPAARLFHRENTLRRLARALAALPVQEAREERWGSSSVAEGIGGRPDAAEGSARFAGAWSQRDMWFMRRPTAAALPPAELHRRVPVLWMRSRVVVEGPLDPALLAAALVAPFARHAILRSLVDEAELDPSGRPILVTLPEWRPEVERVELTALDPAAVRARSERFFAGPLDPARGPPARLALATLGPELHEVWLLQHHLFTDGLSLMLYGREVEEELRSALAGEAPRHATAPSFEQFCRAQDTWLASAEAAPDRAYWRAVLAGAEPLRLPADRSRAEANDFAGGRHDFAVEAATLEGLERLALREGSSLFSLLVHALSEVLHHATGQTDLLLHTFHAGRVLPSLPGAFDVLGPTLSGLPLRVRRPAGGEPRALRRSAHQVVEGALAHAAVPYELMRAELAPELPAPAACLMYQGFVPRRAAVVGPLQVRAPEPLGFGAGLASFDLELVLWPAGEGLAGVAAYATQVFAAGTAAALVERFLAELRALARS